MRQDMSRVLREVHTGRHLSFQGRKVEMVDGEPVDIGRVPMRPREQGWDDIVRSRYAPLFRFLKSRVGRPWAEVYAEASSTYVRGMWASVRTWLSEHVSQEVFRNAAGELVYGAPYGGVQLVSWNDFYVHPDTGLLCQSDNELRHRTRWKEHREKEAAARALVFREGSDGVQYHKREGLWYEVKLADSRLLSELQYPVDRFIKKRVYHPLASDRDREQLYSKPYLYSVAHRVLGRRAVKQLGLP